MRHNSKPDIGLEVPERLRIYLMSDVIFQRSASLDFAFVSAKMGTDDRTRLHPAAAGLRRGEAEDREQKTRYGRHGDQDRADCGRRAEGSQAGGG